MPVAPKAAQKIEAVKTDDGVLTLFEKIRSEVKVPEPLVITDEITLYCPNKKQLELSQAADSEEESNRILIGEHYDALVQLFDGQPPHYWAKFNQTYLNHFFDVPLEPES